ncbi:hypothetical protein GALMADRAFT_594252 [Galerina marginata CBS 339.88]|uniref:DUF6533 domain-containing protein n=1 Tax=Galerina marginata (strain CBS 339.88) TaxID=685588 RepID=A0A067SSM3_GALM3|nr:hypothetical protein GALMADRAFT_594252 [Galerina marginata CBS 339.88]
MSTGIPGVDLFAVTVNGYIWFASYTIVLYDYACTIETEVKHVWSCPWSIGLVLFYFNRYLPFVDIIIYVRATLYPMPSPTDCLWIYPLIIWFTTIGLLISETIILLRTYAIWGRRLLMYWIVLFIVIGIFGSMLALISWKTAIDFKKNTLSIGSIPPEHFNCQATTFFSFNGQSTFCLLFFYLLVFLGEAIIMTLTIIRAREHVSRASVLWITQLYKNGIIYCACMLGLSLLNFSMILFAPAVYKPVFLPVERALHSVFGNWVVFLVLENRQSRSSENGENNRPITTYRGSTMDVFTSVFPDTNDGGFDLSHRSSWQERADREWVR